VTPPRIGSLFSGYAGLDMAVEAFFGATTAWHVQYDPEDPHQYAAAILAHHYPGVPNHGDITRVDWSRVEPVDILTGGFPCTDVSLAGARAGLNSQTRSGLWAHMARAIAVLNPKLVVIENVRGLLSAPADGDLEPCTWCLGDGGDEPVLRALGAVLADLAGLGFDAEWVGVPASDVGAPHERFRVFILAWPAHAEGPRLEIGGLRGLLAGGGQPAADADHLGAHGAGARRTGRDEPADDGQPAADTDRGVVRVESVAEPWGCGRLPAEHDVQPGQPNAGWRTRANSAGDGRGEGRTEPARLGGGPDAAVSSSPDWGVYEPAIRRWEHVTGRPAPRPVDDRGRLAPVFVEWMMGLPSGWITGIPVPDGMTASQARNAQLKAGGNGVVPQQAAAAWSELMSRYTEAP
jgi:DNA (cytosine-5)-methyltransferase 1